MRAHALALAFFAACTVIVACQDSTRKSRAPNEVLPLAGAGEIVCGAERCKVGKEKCCHLKNHCEPLRGEHDEFCDAEGGRPGWTGEGGGPAYLCDGREDCPSNEVCCQIWFGTPDTDSFATRCGSAPCDFHEACRAGHCAPGFTCTASADPNVPGSCLVAEPKVACGDLTCSGAQPACSWDRTKKAAACVARDADRATGNSGKDSDHSVYVMCTKNADCGGIETCCAREGNAYCMGKCLNAAEVCRTSADCPPDGGDMGKLRGCLDASGDDLSWFKECTYETQPFGLAPLTPSDPTIAASPQGTPLTHL